MQRRMDWCAIRYIEHQSRLCSNDDKVFEQKNFNDFVVDRAHERIHGQNIQHIQP